MQHVRIIQYIDTNGKLVKDTGFCTYFMVFVGDAALVVVPIPLVASLIVINIERTFPLLHDTLPMYN